MFPSAARFSRVSARFGSQFGTISRVERLSQYYCHHYGKNGDSKDNSNSTNRVTESEFFKDKFRAPPPEALGTAGGGFNDFNLRRIKERIDNQKLERIKQMREAISQQSSSNDSSSNVTTATVTNSNDDETRPSTENENNDESATKSSSKTGENSSKMTNVKRRKRILITGANGNLGAKLLQFWRNRHELILVDCEKPSDLVNYCLMTSKLSHSYVTVDLLHPRDIEALTNMIRNADYIVHLAAQNPFPDANWDDCVASIDMTNRVLLGAYDVHKQGINYAFEQALSKYNKQLKEENGNNNKSLMNEKCNLKRIIYASSNHIMGGYRSEGSSESEAIDNGFKETALLEPSKVPMFPGTSFMLDDGFIFDSTPYAIAKVAGERLCLQSSMNSHNHLRSLRRKLYYENEKYNSDKRNNNEKNEISNESFANVKALEHIVVRIGWCQPGENLPSTLNATGTPKDESLHKGENEDSGDYDDRESVERWFRNMWLSNIDLFRLFETCVDCDLDASLHGYTIVNGVSRNSDSRWNVDDNTIGFNPIYDVNNFDPHTMPHEHQEQNKIKTNNSDFSKCN